MARRKETALDVPSTLDEAIVLVDEYVAAERQAAHVRLSIEVLIDAAKTERDANLTSIETDQKRRFAALKAWWEAGGRDVAKGRRSVELAGASMGVRLSPPKVKLKRGLKADTVVVWLRTVRWLKARALVRTKYELDKQALIKLVQSDQEVRETLATKGVTVEQADEFFIDAGLDEDALRKELA